PTTPTHPISVSLNRPAAHPDLPSFPTRRSSDLQQERLIGQYYTADWHHGYIAARTSHPANKRDGLTDKDPIGRASRDDSWGNHIDRKSTRLNSSHLGISYAVFCLKKKKKKESDT